MKYTALVALFFFCAIVLSAAQRTCTPRGTSNSGVCQDVTQGECVGGQYFRGACPGNRNIQCCVRSSGGSQDTPRGTGVGTGSGTGVSTGGGRVGGGWGSYQPPASARSLLGRLFSLSATSVNWGYRGSRATFMLPGGAFYIESKMDTDCDGAPSCPSIDSSGQTRTSYSWRGSPIDALRANYFVLPSNIRSRLGNTRLALGDIAAVVYNGRMEFAIYADNGPTSKIGEGSVKLVQALGFNPYRNGRICCGISSGVVVVVFPGSRGSYSSPYDSASVRSAGMARLNALTGGSQALSADDSNFTLQPQSLSLSIFNGLIISASVIAVVVVIVGVVFLVKSSINNRDADYP